MSPSIVLMVAWPAAVLAAGWQWRPRRRLDLGDRRPMSGSTQRVTARLGSVAGPIVEPLGRAVRLVAGRAPDGAADRRAGAAVAAGAMLLVVAPMFALPVAAAWWVVPHIRRRRSAQARTAAVQAELPLVADLFVLATGAGLTVPLAVTAVGRRTCGPLGSALVEAERRTALGQHPADALAGVIDVVGDVARPLITVLVSAERYGTPLVAPLERLAEEIRRQRRRQAEEAARRVPVKLLFPLVLCTLPAFALLTVVPLLLSAVGHLQV